MFIVHVHHSGTGHGDESHIVLATLDPKLALQTALAPEKLGYAYYEECYICISDVTEDVVFPTRDTTPIVMINHFHNHTWTQKWFDPTFKTKVKIPEIA